MAFFDQEVATPMPTMNSNICHCILGVFMHMTGTTGKRSRQNNLSPGIQLLYHLESRPVNECVPRNRAVVGTI